MLSEILWRGMKTLETNEKKGVTVKIDAELHAEVKRYIEEHSMTMGDFVALALQDELHPKNNIREDKNMGNMRTLAFQVPEELFQKIKDYLQRNNMTQKGFVIGLIETEIERDLTQKSAESEQHEAAARAFEGGYVDKSEDMDDVPDESENLGISMGM